MIQALRERYADLIVGVLPCYDRLTLPVPHADCGSPGRSFPSICGFRFAARTVWLRSTGLTQADLELPPMPAHTPRRWYCPVSLHHQRRETLMPHESYLCPANASIVGR
jgi:hypothetical protein